jgi:hypothetical protein
LRSAQLRSRNYIQMECLPLLRSIIMTGTVCRRDKIFSCHHIV